MALFPFRKPKKTFREVNAFYRRKRKKLGADIQQRFETLLKELQNAIFTKDLPKAESAAKDLDKLSILYLHKTFFDRAFDFVSGILVALVIAILIRQVWFEFYTIPTGSMRPTLQEGDYLVVSKSSFGVNTPLNTSHLYFNPGLMERGGITIFTSANLDVQDPDTLYFWLIPGRKQFVKRMVAKPEDQIYFYGGQMYGYDSSGKELTMLSQSPWFEKIEHIPFLRFADKVEVSDLQNGVYKSAIIYQMNEPVAKLSMNSYGHIEGEMLYPKKGEIKDYYDLWGIKNFAMTRILDKEEVSKLTDLTIPSSAPLYLELTHHPSIKNAKLSEDFYRRRRPELSYSRSILPMQGRHLHALMDHMTTVRFIVKDGYAYRYGDPHPVQEFLPKFTNVPNGTYEFDNGALYQIGFLGIPKKLSKEHPLYQFSYERVKTLYNLGVEFNTYFSPSRKNQILTPSRYAYFRNGELYLLSHPIYNADDEVLQNFIDREKETKPLELAFIDQGPPIINGSLDEKLIQKNGLKIPAKSYLMLGDNHAVSGDSRSFGFVPEENIKGRPTLVFWPPSKNWGAPFQPSFPWITLPKVVIWALAFIALIIWRILEKRRWKEPLKFK